MGDRVLIQFRDVGGKTSPVIYGHWAGSEATKILCDLASQMSHRLDDVDYIAARCVGRLTAVDPSGDCGIGIWNRETALQPKDTHGDAGIFLVEVSKSIWRVRHLCGYKPENYQEHPQIEWTRVTP